MSIDLFWIRILDPYSGSVLLIIVKSCDTATCRQELKLEHKEKKNVLKIIENSSNDNDGDPKSRLSDQAT